MGKTEKISTLWHKLYADKNNDELNTFLAELEDLKRENSTPTQEEEWYKDAVVYSLYVDLFNKDFKGLTEKLDYIQNLGANCIWLLPILDSPMRDAGFDIKDYQMIRADLLGLGEDATNKEKLSLFQDFLDEAHNRGLKVIFDIAMNHCSEEHPWFVDAKKGEESAYHDFFIWSDTTEKYKDARLLFKGMCPSNWEACGDKYYFHRFFEFQPDLNYRNPTVLTTMTKNLLFWLNRGVDGFRADAIPYLWKEENTDCENLEKTHVIVKFYRAVLDFVRPNTLLLAEACQAPKNVVKYFGEGDECHAGYHFPLMPQMFKALAMENGDAIKNILSKEVTPEIPEKCQWFTFLRCHDELSLELVYVSEEDRAYIHENYCHDPKWNFRVGEGISARLSELMKLNTDKIELIYSVMLTLPGTPIVYYGDEFGKLNDEKYYSEQIALTKKDDTRFLVRGKIDWDELSTELKNKDSFHYDVFSRISNLLKKRNSSKAFSRGTLEWVETDNPAILAYKREWKNDNILVVHNLKNKKITTNIQISSDKVNILGKNPVIDDNDNLILSALETQWITN